MQPFTLSRIPELRFGAGKLTEAGVAAAALGGSGATVLVVADPVLERLGITPRLIETLAAAGLRAVVYDGLAGEPKQKDIDTAADLARGAGARSVIGLGGGSALDTAKLVASCAVSGLQASAYALCATPLPANHLPVIAVPTTAGTGSEVTRVAVFSDDNGAKVWAWGDELKPSIAILDPELTVAVPPQVTAATGLDALVHAMEAATNANRTDGNDLYCLRAVALIAAHLEKAVKDPADLDARGAMLLASCYGGIGIDNCGTALAHNISHAVADLAPIPHGRATGLAMYATIDWVADGNPLAFARIAGAMAADDAVTGYRRLVHACGLNLSLAGDGLGPADAERLARHMASPANEPMRRSTVRYPSEEDLVMLAERFLALA